MPFEKGHKGGAIGQGRKKGTQNWNALFKEELEKVPKGSRETARVQVVKRLISLALEGEQWAMRDLLDRCMGKPQQAIQVDHTSNGAPLNASISFNAPKIIDIPAAQPEELPESTDQE